VSAAIAFKCHIENALFSLSLRVLEGKPNEDRLLEEMIHMRREYNIMCRFFQPLPPNHPFAPMFCHICCCPEVVLMVVFTSCSSSEERWRLLAKYYC
jgi:hypothetical protein